MMKEDESNILGGGSVVVEEEAVSSAQVGEQEGPFGKARPSARYRNKVLGMYVDAALERCPAF